MTPAGIWAAAISALGAAVAAWPGLVAGGAVVSASLSALSAALVLYNTWPARPDLGWLGWAAAPGGVVAAALGSYLVLLEGHGSWWGLEGASAAALLLAARLWLERRCNRPVARTLASVVEQLPSTARVPAVAGMASSDTELRPVPAESLRTGQEIVALEGDVVAVDGVVKAGGALALLHPGASTPVPRKQGDPLLAGARIVSGAVRVMATRVGPQRALVRPQRYGDGAARDGAVVAQRAYQLARWGGALVWLAAASIWLVVEPAGFSTPLCSAAAVLIAAPLSALRSGTSVSLVAAGAAAGLRGIVFQDARALERAGLVSVAAIFPHGTLTKGKPEVAELLALHGADADEIVALAAAAEAEARGQPIAMAILRFAERRGVTPTAVRRVNVLPGRGLTALAPGGEELIVGNRRLLLDEGVSVAMADAEAVRFEASGDTSLFVALGGQLRAVLSLHDPVRPGARAAIQRMLDLGIEVVLLSGDQRGTVEALGRGLDVAHVKAELLPEERAQEVTRLGSTGDRVAAFGHPGTDDAALAAAEVPIVLGAAGGAAGEHAIALVSTDFRDAAAALWIARLARNEAQRAVRTALGSFVLALTAAGVGVLTPAAAALLAALTDTHAARVGARLLGRVALRLPAPS